VEPGTDAIRLARELGVPLWCDDTALRQRARAEDVATFGLIDLCSVLERRGIALEVAEVSRHLAEEYVVDLPLAAEDLIAIATAHEWEVGPAHTAIARDEWWRHRSGTWEDAWHRFAIAAREHSAEALVDATQAALMGSTAAVSQGYSTQRYQHVVILALAACHEAGLPAPEQYLQELAEHGSPALVPRPKYVLRGLMEELRRREVDNPEAVARSLLPEVEPN
jgi:hypothetical protein